MRLRPYILGNIISRIDYIGIKHQKHMCPKLGSLSLHNVFYVFVSARQFFYYNLYHFRCFFGCNGALTPTLEVNCDFFPYFSTLWFCPAFWNRRLSLAYSVMSTYWCHFSCKKICMPLHNCFYERTFWFYFCFDIKRSDIFQKYFDKKLWQNLRILQIWLNFDKFW